MKRPTRDSLAKNLARARLIILQLERQAGVEAVSVFLPFIDNELRAYYGSGQWDMMLSEQMGREESVLERYRRAARPEEPRDG